MSIASQARCDVITVDGRANLFGAGLVTPPGVSPGVTPPTIALGLAPEFVSFDSITGTVRFAPDRPLYGPEGGEFPGGGMSQTNIDSAGSISGLTYHQNTFLAGVFITDAEPTGAAPERLNYSFVQNFLETSPLLNQSFFIGNGKTDGGVSQRFNVPTGATRLALGMIDGYDIATNTISGTPRFYDDNSGTFSASYTITAVPEPSSGFVVVATAVLVRFRHSKE